MKPVKKSSALLDESPPQGGLDHVLAYMKAHGVPLARENYLALNFPEGVPDPLPAELEQMMPKQFRLQTRYTKGSGTPPSPAK